MHWIYLIIAIFMEVSGTTMMKLSAGFTKWIPAVFMAFFYLASLTFLTLSLKKIEVGTAYAVWSGIGTAAIAVIGVLVFRESLTLLKTISIGLIIAGVVGLNLSSGMHQP